MQQQKKERQVVWDFLSGYPICIGREYHEHIYCRAHQRYLGINEECLRKCYKCQEEFEDRALRIRMKIVNKLISKHVYWQTMETYFRKSLKQIEETSQTEEKALK